MIEAPSDPLDAKVPLRIDWPGGEAVVEVRKGDGWKRIATATPPFTSKPLPRGSAVRLRVGGQILDASSAPGVYTPSDFAAASGPGLRGARVVDLYHRTEVVYAATLGGGLARWDGGRWHHWDRRNGLPGSLAIAVDVDDDGVIWAGTDHGLARIGESLDVIDGLPDPYTQTVFADGDTVWAGTFRGLARVTGEVVETVLEPWSCFALLRGSDQRVWVGYEGLRGLPEGEPIEGVPAEWNVYDTDPLPTGIWLATQEEGLVWWEEGLTETIFRPEGDGVYAIARSDQQLFVAAEADGLVQLTTDGPRHYDRSDGLPSDVVNEVIEGPKNKVWAGTDRGVALVDPGGRATPLPLAPLAAGIAVHGIAASKHGRAVASADGLVWLGNPKKTPTGWEALVAAAAAPTDVLHARGDWWVQTAAAAFRLDRKGRLTRWDTPGPTTRLAATDDAVLLAGEGLHWWMPDATMLSPSVLDETVVDVATVGATVFVATEREVILEGAGGDRRWSSIPRPRALATDAAGAWVASDGGLYRITGDLAEVGADNDWGALVAVATDGLSVWVASADGRLYGPDPTAPREIDLVDWLDGTEVTRLQAVPQGVWVSSTSGLWFVSL